MTQFITKITLLGWSGTEPTISLRYACISFCVDVFSNDNFLKYVFFLHSLSFLHIAIFLFVLLVMFLLVSLDCHYKIPQNGWLKLQKFISHSFGSWEVQDQGAGWFGFWWKLSPGLWMATFMLCVWMTSYFSVHLREENELFGVYFYRDTNPMGFGPHPYDII